MNDRAAYANANAALLPLADKSVHMIATSPPYWGLRDYGTAKWEGGDPGCDHAPERRGGRFSTPVSSKQASNAGSGTASERDCRCGATRVDNQLGLERVHDCGAWARRSIIGFRGVPEFEEDGDGNAVFVGRPPEPIYGPPAPPCGACYVCNLRTWAAEMWRVLRDDGVMFLNLGDSYASNGGPEPAQTKWQVDGASATQNGGKSRRAGGGLKPKDLCGIPWRVALALQADGWYLRSAITWCKTNPMPESVQGSHYSRHRVTIEEYENLSRLRESERRNQDGAGNLPHLSPGEGARSKAPVSTEREGASNSQGKGAARGRKGEAPTVQSIQTGAGKQGQVRGNGKGQGHAETSHSEIQEFRTWQEDGGLSLFSDERFPAQDRAEEGSQLSVYSYREGQGQAPSGLCQTQTGYSSRPASNGRGLAGDSGTAQASLLLLREEEDTDTGSCDTRQQGRIAREREHSASVPELQFEQERQDYPALLDCPGCPKCEKTGGYISRKTAGRPTKATEQIFLFSKSPFYFYDSEAIKTETGANARDWWEISTVGYSGAHYAVWPPALVERMVKAGTSERGVCPECGKPWARIVEKGEPVNAPRNPNDALPYTANGSTNHGNGATTLHKVRESATVDWRPTCDHDAAPVPAIVLDPFCGSGTTLMVARQLGRVGLGFDLSLSYLRENARTRLGHDKLRAWGRGIVDTGDYSDLFRARANGNGAATE